MEPFNAETIAKIYGVPKQLIPLLTPKKKSKFALIRERRAERKGRSAFNRLMRKFERDYLKTLGDER